MQEVTIYSDGACKGNPGPGGWGAVLVSAGHEKELFGGESPTTNNRMELMAVIEALRALKRPCVINIYPIRSMCRRASANGSPAGRSAAG